MPSELVYDARAAVRRTCPPPKDVPHSTRCTSGTRCQFAQLIVLGARARVDERTVSDAEAEMLAVSLVGSLAYAGLHWMRRGYPLSVEQMVRNAMRLMRGALSELEREAVHGRG